MADDSGVVGESARDDADESDILESVRTILRSSLTGESRRVAVLPVSDDRTVPTEDGVDDEGEGESSSSVSENHDRDETSEGLNTTTDERLGKIVDDFAVSTELDELVFVSELGRDQRMVVHQSAAHHGLHHRSFGARGLGERRAHVSKRPLRVASRTIEPLETLHSSDAPTRVQQRSRSASGSVSNRSARDVSMTLRRGLKTARSKDDIELLIFSTIEEFRKTPLREYAFPRSLTATQRQMVHTLAESVGGLVHTSVGKHGRDRHVVLRKLTDEELEQQRLRLESFRETFEEMRHEQSLERNGANADSASSSEQESGVSMSGAPARRVLPTNHFERLVSQWEERVSIRPGRVRVASWNIEWMDFFFASDEEFHVSNAAQGIDNVKAVCQSIAHVIEQLSADVLAIEEGPRSIERMRHFVKSYLDERYEVFGGLDGSSQRLYWLVRRGGPVRNAELYEPAMEFLKKPWNFDVSGSFKLEPYSFVRTPLVLRGDVHVNGVDQPLFCVALHAKSKGISDGSKLWQSVDPRDKDEFVRRAIKNRRRIAAECSRTRKCLDRVVYDHVKEPLVVTVGDMNDGPGMDVLENLYLLFDSVESLLGSPFQHKKMLSPLLIRSIWVDKEDQWTAEFYDYVSGEACKKVLIDHIFTSSRLYRSCVTAGIAHALYNETLARMREGYLARQRAASDTNVPDRDQLHFVRACRPSDHRPVYADFF